MLLKYKKNIRYAYTVPAPNPEYAIYALLSKLLGLRIHEVKRRFRIQRTPNTNLYVVYDVVEKIKFYAKVTQKAPIPYWGTTFYVKPSNGRNEFIITFYPETIRKVDGEEEQKKVSIVVSS